MPFRIGCVVEGHGEVQALPLLLRRLAGELAPGTHVEIPPPLRRPRDRLIGGAMELEKAVEFMAVRVSPLGGIMVVLDAEDDCPAELAPRLQNRVASQNLPVSVVMAKREFEAWFLAAAESLRGRRGLPQNLAPPPDPEAIAGAKEWLARQMEHGSYSETLDQPALAAIFDTGLARQRSDSFNKFSREVERLLDLLRTRAQDDPQEETD